MDATARFQHKYFYPYKNDNLVIDLYCSQASKFYALNIKTDFKYAESFDMFVSDIIICIVLNEHKKIDDITITTSADYENYVRNFFSTDFTEQTGHEALKCIEQLLDAGEPVIVCTCTDRLPFYKYFKSPGFMSKKITLAELHSFLIIGHSGEYIYYVEAPFNHNEKYYESIPGNPTIGRIRKSDLLPAFELYVYFAAMQVRAMDELDPFKCLTIALSNAVHNFYPKESSKNRIFGIDALEFLRCAFQDCDFLKIDNGISIINISEIDFFRWKVRDFVRCRKILLFSLIKYKHKWDGKKVDMLCGLLEYDINNWMIMIALMIKISVRSDNKNRIQLLDRLNENIALEQNIIESISGLIR